ncbi:hypothetical protein BC834DRAFT_966607 [Gloeopeniophorella convolvens]|nr:hypothetical protein BC834DRAFT_966607 [Gloeopeniophorella convolvens]
MTSPRKATDKTNAASRRGEKVAASTANGDTVITLSENALVAILTQVGQSTIDVPPTNHLRVCKKGGPIEGQYRIDLGLPRSEVVRGSAWTERNLHLETKSGKIRAEVWTDAAENMPPETVKMELESKNGSVFLKLHPPRAARGHSRPPLDVTLRANLGGVTLSLPRTFRGTINIESTGHERVLLSPELQQCAALRSDAGAGRVYSVRDPGRQDASAAVDDEVKIEGDTATQR